MIKNTTKFRIGIIIFSIIIGYCISLWRYYHNIIILQDEIASLLKIYKAYDDNGEIVLKRLGRAKDGGYIVPIVAAERTDILMSYGIANDISFEEEFSTIFNKASYGFDCGIDNIYSSNKLFTFINECIGTDNFLYSKQKSSKKINSFAQQLDNLNLKDKKLFIKMDIEGAEYKALNDILPYSHNITAIVLEIHFLGYKKSSRKKAIKLLNELQKDFVLIHVHANNCVLPKWESKNINGELTSVIELSYVNKNLLKDYYLSNDQTHPTSLDMPNCPQKKDIEFEILSGSK